jgi:hypothetical protein
VKYRQDSWEFQMNDQTRNDFSNGSGADAAMSEAEQTLRLIARLPAPQGLEDRVQAGLAAGRIFPRHTARVLQWPPALRPASGWMRTAAAAAIVFVVAGGGWGVYSRVQPPQAAKVIVMPRVVSPSGFSNAGAMRTPNTLNGPMIANPANTNAPQPKSLPLAAKKPVRRASSALPKKAPIQPVTPAK